MAMGVRRPVGVVAAIAPWNAAQILSARAIAAPLVFGNTVVLKPSEESPYVGGLIWGEIFAEAGLPAGVLNVVTHAPGEAGPIGDELVANPHVRRLNFTGSTATGRHLAEAAGRHLKRVVLELGGQNPLIVLSDADIEYAVDASAFGAYLRLGSDLHVGPQDHRRAGCGRGVRRAAREEDPGNYVRRSEGPAQRRRAADQRVRGRDGQAPDRRAVEKGARVLAGGEAVGPCIQATLIADLPEDTELARNETFGPVAVVEVVADQDEAVHARMRRATASLRGSSPPTRSAALLSRNGSSRASCM